MIHAFLQGLIDVRTGRLEQAGQDHYQLAKLYMAQGQPDQAQREYQTFIEIYRKADEGVPELVDVFDNRR